MLVIMMQVLIIIDHAEYSVCHRGEDEDCGRWVDEDVWYLCTAMSRKVLERWILVSLGS